MKLIEYEIADVRSRILENMSEIIKKFNTCKVPSEPEISFSIKLLQFTPVYGAYKGKDLECNVMAYKYDRRTIIFYDVYKDAYVDFSEIDTDTLGMMHDSLILRFGL